MSTGYSRADDDSDDVDLQEPLIMDDISEQETTDVMERASRVRWEIKKAEIRTNYDDKDDKSAGHVKRLSLQVAVGPDGTDGEGAFANRRVFMDYVVAFTKGDGVRESEWWTKKARGPAKELFTALEFDLKEMPPIDKEFLESLVGREFIADLLKREQQDKTDEINPKTGKPLYKNNGTYRNELANHRVAD
jgi:hypothetical protein